MHDEKYLKGAACAKHFAVHSGPEDMRHYFNAEVSNTVMALKRYRCMLR